MANELQRSQRLVIPGKKEDLNPEWIALLERYKTHCTMQNRSEKTIYNYERDLIQWFCWIKEHQPKLNPQEATDEDVEAFLVFCQQHGNNVDRIKRRASAISSFFIFLRKRRIVNENPVANVDRPKKTRPVVRQTFLTIDQCRLIEEKLLNQPDYRIYAYFIFSIDTMARVAAITSIKWDQVDFDACTVNDVLEKEGYLVTLFFTPKTRDVLLKLKEYYEKNEMLGEYVFVGKRAGKINPVSVSTCFIWTKKIGEMIGVESLHPHDFRHSGSQILKSQGMPLEDISSLLNHKGTDVTRKHYLQQDKKQLGELKQRFSFLAENDDKIK